MKNPKKEFNKKELLVLKVFEEIKNFSKNYYVYLLILENEVVYVGKSTTLMNRIREHKKDKNYDDVLFIKTNKKNVGFLESGLIKILGPRLNISLSKPIKLSPNEMKILKYYKLHSLIGGQ